ncbi:MAG: response regulator [Armatimonadota bacterium]|nr:response regulator [Armatimonadota bacterium]
MTHSTWRVVVVDDQEPVRESVCDMLRELGHEVCASVGTGEEAVEAVSRLHPDIVLMDIQMPGIGGIEAARQIRDLPQPAPVLFLSALGDEEVAEQAARSGGFGYLVKPFHARQLGPAMQTAISRFRELQASAGGAHVEAAHLALEEFSRQLRGGGLDAAVPALLAAVGKQLQVKGVVLCLADPSSPQGRFPARWGEEPPDRALLWVQGMARVRQPGQAAGSSLGPDSPALAAALLGTPEDALGLLAVYDTSRRVFGPDDTDLLATFAAHLGEALQHIRAEQPMAWRRWANRQ